MKRLFILFNTQHKINPFYNQILLFALALANSFVKSFLHQFFLFLFLKNEVLAI
jgi:hypothetical protein